MGDLVPLFPLPNVVLLPRAVIPLHIFEDRYRAMTADALAGDQRIALALLAPGWETDYHGTPALESTVCVAQILEHQRLPDGRYNLLLQGLSRSRIILEEHVGLYRAAELDEIESECAMELDLADLRIKLQLLFKGPLSNVDHASQFTELLQTIISTSDAADVIAFHTLSSFDAKKQMLEDTNAPRRISRLISQLADMAASLRYSPLSRPLNPLDDSPYPLN